MKQGSKYNIDIPIWIDKLRRQLPRDQQRQWQKAIKDVRWEERHHWCKKNGYCKKRPSGFENYNFKPICVIFHRCSFFNYLTLTGKP